MMMMMMMSLILFCSVLFRGAQAMSRVRHVPLSRSRPRARHRRAGACTVEESAPIQLAQCRFPRAGRFPGAKHTHPFNGPFSATTRVSRYQKGKTGLDFTDGVE